MNKTVTANIGGIVFHIEVDAFEMMNNYLNKIRSYFQNSIEREEIMADIEARIAELLNPKLSANNQVIRIKDVEEVINIMGKPEQFIVDEDETGNEEGKTFTRTKRKLFRDPEDRMLGGVASGIGHYVGLDAIWVRVIFILIFLLGTSGFWIYLLLWILMPEAKTAADKLQMKGEPVNIDSIGRAFEEGAKKMNQRIKDMDSGKFGHKLESFFESLFHILGVLITGFLKLIGKVLGIILLVVGIILAFSLLAGMFSSEMLLYTFSTDGVFAMDAQELFLSVFSSEGEFTLVKIALFLIIGIPVLALIYSGIKLLFGIKGHTGIGKALGILWFVGITGAIVLSIKIGSEFKSESKVSEYQQISSGFTEYVLELNQNEVPGNELISSSDNDFILHYDKSNIYYGIPTLNIERSFTDSLTIRLVKESRGSSKKNSTENAKNIVYEFQQQGELLSFNPFISFDRQHKIRGQEVQLTLLLPLGKIVYLDESLRELLYDVENVTNTLDRDMLGKKWIMTEKGLACLDCPDIEGESSGDF